MQPQARARASPLPFRKGAEARRAPMEEAASHWPWGPVQPNAAPGPQACAERERRLPGRTKKSDYSSSFFVSTTFLPR